MSWVVGLVPGLVPPPDFVRLSRQLRWTAPAFSTQTPCIVDSKRATTQTSFGMVSRLSRGGDKGDVHFWLHALESSRCGNQWEPSGIQWSYESQDPLAAGLLPGVLPPAPVRADFLAVSPGARRNSTV